MKNRVKLWPILHLLSLMAVSCQLLPTPTPTPPPGWYGDARELLVDESALPGGWHADLYEEANAHPRANHVHRTFGRRNLAGTIIQDVWRGYTDTRAAEYYTELRNSQYQPNSPLPPGNLFVPFEPPSEISFRSAVADDFYLACGWWTTAYCLVVARYRNYVVLLRLPHQAEVDGHHTSGLTYTEIESVVRAMDARFEWFLDSLATPVP